MSWGGKLALQMAYFCPHGQRHGRVSWPCATHGHVTQLMLHTVSHMGV
ncbi:hypothetical protein F383_36733 [Gossypium arboreum]|uniref:Uncharacterized protein n=1 Tax=Gossypium arboreum TaxID=29729 RepID=A0A0B0MAM9_GOSAR|nr:hypothetical protein F383_36733 [Gossypium arboreum]